MFSSKQQYAITEIKYDLLIQIYDINVAYKKYGGGIKIWFTYLIFRYLFNKAYHILPCAGN